MSIFSRLCIAFLCLVAHLLFAAVEAPGAFDVLEGDDCIADEAACDELLEDEQLIDEVKLQRSRHQGDQSGGLAEEGQVKDVELQSEPQDDETQIDNQENDELKEEAAIDAEVTEGVGTEGLKNDHEFQYVQTNYITLRIVNTDYASYEDMEVRADGRPIDIHGYVVKVLAAYKGQEEFRGCSAFMEIANQNGNIQNAGWAFSAHPSFFDSKMGKYRLILLSCFNKDGEQ